MSFPTIDFETYSEAGYVFDGTRWRSISKSPPHGLGAVGAAAYAEHPSTEVLSLAYDLADGNGPQLWIPRCPPPQLLFDHIATGGRLAAWNVQFEWYMWGTVCIRYGWPPLPPRCLWDPMAQARAWGLPGALGTVGDILNPQIQKDTSGKSLIRKFSKPRQPTKKDKRLRVMPADAPVDAMKLYQYCITDIETTAEIAGMLPPLQPTEAELWALDQTINRRGMHIDLDALRKLARFADAIEARYIEELREITGGAVHSIGELTKIQSWLNAHFVTMPNMQAETVSAAIKHKRMPDKCRRVLEIRAILSQSSVKKIPAIERRLTADGRLHGLLEYCGAERTARWAGRGPQPQNLPGKGPDVVKCGACGQYQTPRERCVQCGDVELPDAKWGPEAIDDLLQIDNSVDLEEIFGDPFTAIAGCLRGLFVAAPGHDLICSDYSAIEAVVLAMLAGEQWRIEVFRTHGRIYETSASKITGVPLETMLAYKQRTGEHHPYRKLGKVAELASGYSGWIDAWKRFGADEHFETDQEIKKSILTWRQESPAIVEFWGGQVRKDPRRWAFSYEYFGLEGAAVSAVLSPSQPYSYRRITYTMLGDVLYCRLPSGRSLCYHRPRLQVVADNYSKEDIYQLSFEGLNSDLRYGPMKTWCRIPTYGGKLTENVVQAVARDILAEALLRLETAGYPIVLHVHDEPVAEVPTGTGSIEEFERIMAEPPAWASDWPIRVGGRWRGRRYRK